MSKKISYTTLNTQLKQAGIPMTASELDGFLSGLLCGNVKDKDWQTLLFQFTNDDHTYPTSLLNDVTSLYKQIKQSLADIVEFNFQLLLPNEEESVFIQADALSEWVNHFLLGLGIVLPSLDKEKGDIGEALDDLQDIARLTYEPDENENELMEALEEVKEYVCTLVMLFYTHFCGVSHVPDETQHIH